MLASVAAGMVIDRLAGPAPVVWWIAAAASLVAWVTIGAKLADETARRRAGSILTVVAATAVGGARHHATWYEFAADDVGAYVSAEPRPVTLEGVLVEAPRSDAAPVAGFRSIPGRLRRPVRPSPGNTEAFRTRFMFRPTLLRDGAGAHAVEGLVDVEIAAGRPAAAAGDRAAIVGRLEERKPPMNPGEFDFAAHYRADRKLGLLRVDSADRMTKLDSRSWWNFGAQLSDRRREAHRLLLANMPDDQAGFASALLLGYRDQLDAADNRAYLRTGTVHILSISGMHVAILAMLLQFGLRIGWVSRRMAALVIIGVTIAYGLLIDAEPPAVRALIVITAVGLSTIFGRRVQAFNVLAVSALIVLAMNPNDLFRIGPQLSFLAAGVLAWFAEQERPDETNPDDDPLDRGSFRRRVRRHATTFGRALLVSTAILAITSPLVAYRFHVISPISLVLTPLVSIPMTLGLLFGMLTLLAAMVLPPAAPWFGTICGYSLRLIETSVVTAQDLPAASYWIPGPSLGATIGFYLLVGAWLLVPAGLTLPGDGPMRAGRRQIRLRSIVGAAAAGWGVVSMIPYHRLPNDCRARCTFIAVDHGLSVLVESRAADGTHSTWLYDCGRLGNDQAAARSIAGVLWSLGISRLDGIVISHADADHYNGLPALLDFFSVDRVVLTRQMADSPNSAARFVRDLAKAAELPVTAVTAGEALPWNRPGCECRVLSPPAGGVAGSDNAQSLVVEMVAEKKRLLLTGDLEGNGLERLLARPPLDCDILLAPHHGSAGSDPPGFAAWSRPQLVIVSGEADRRGPLRSAYEGVGARVLETTAVGAITVTIDAAGRMTVETFR